mgnify:CR=1 FL=1
MSEPAGAEILLVEDSPDDVELTIRALRKARIAASVRVARDGAEALEALLGDEAALAKGLRVVLLDLKLPRLGGFEVLERIRREEATRALPVVVLSSSREECDVRRAYELGANSYVVKPVEFERFSDAVGEVGSYWLLRNETPE